MKRYSALIATYPYLVVVGLIIITALCVTTSLLLGKFPDFSDPQLGFETRGTEIAERLTTWENLQKAVAYNGPLVMNPSGAVPTNRIKPPTRKKSKGVKKKQPKPTGAPGNELTPPRSVPLKGRGSNSQGPFKYWNDNLAADSDVGRVAWVPNTNVSHKLGPTDQLAETLEEEDLASLKRQPPFYDHNQVDSNNHQHNDENHSDHDHSHLSSDGFFCEQLSSSYSRVAVVSVNHKVELFSLEGLKAVCNLQKQLMMVPEMTVICQEVRDGHCCPPWSLPNYITMLNNRSDCSQITEADLSSIRSTLEECQTIITREIELSSVSNTSGVCAEGGAIRNLLYYLLDSRFDGSRSYLPSLMIFLPIARSASVLPYYQELSPTILANDLVIVDAADFGAKGALFDLHLVRGTVLMVGGFLVILICLWSYTGSLFLTLSAVTAVLMSLLIAHFLYTCVFAISFFPFMNLLATVIAIGIGADDAFIFCKLWSCTSDERTSSGGMVSQVSATLRTAAPSMFVTTFTTAAALFANCISPITAINCFSIFSGTAVIVNLVLMLSWLPACVVIRDNWCQTPLVPLRWRPAFITITRTIKENLTQVKVLADRYLLVCVVRLRYLWVLFLGGVAIASAVVVLHYPRLRLPDHKTFPLFESSHPFERYETSYKDFYWFERDQTDSWDEIGGTLPLQFVWGVIPTDNGNHLDPASRGRLVYDDTFDISSVESQTWLLHFCQKIREQHFYQPTIGLMLPNCFIETFKSWMTRRCRDVSGVDRSPCCEASSFPFSRRVFKQCAKQAAARLHATPSNLNKPGVAGPRFSRGMGEEIKVLVIEYESNYTYSNSFKEMSAFYATVETWFQNELLTAPKGLRKGWFITDLGFWDLQAALSEGTEAAIALSLGVALLVVFASTLNAVLSLFTVLTIAAVIFVTVAFLVLMGWRLNVLESVSVTTAIGLSVDFALHYAVHYRQSDEEKREPAVVHAITRMTGPTAMGALTTGAAGAFMLLSSVLPYIQIGVLLVVLPAISWLYSTVFLMSLLAIAGPQRGCGQFRRPSPGEWCREPSGSKSTTVPAMWSDTTLSTSSGAVEIHEMEALTRGQRRRRPRAQSPALPEDIDELPS